jgi:hypothetical protein
MCVDFFDVQLTGYPEGREELIKLWMSWYASNMHCPIHVLKAHIESLDNHKGTLTVRFKSLPTEQMMNYAIGAWEECNESQVDFEYIENVQRIVKVEAPHGTSI